MVWKLMFRACGSIEGGTREVSSDGLNGAIYSLVYSAAGEGVAIIDLPLSLLCCSCEVLSCGAKRSSTAFARCIRLNLVQVYLTE